MIEVTSPVVNLVEIEGGPTLEVTSTILTATTIGIQGPAGPTSLSGFTTDDLAEGGTNLYFTDERVDDRVADFLVAGDNIILTEDDVGNTLRIDGEPGVATPSTTTERAVAVWGDASGDSLANSPATIALDGQLLIPPAPGLFHQLAGEGVNSVAIGGSGFFGDTRALGESSIAIGVSAKADVDKSIVIGPSQVTASNAIVIGVFSAASHSKSTVIGFQTVSDKPDQVKIGGGQTKSVTIASLLELTPLSADPSSPVDGAVWLRSDLNELRVQLNGVTKKIDLVNA